MNKKYVILDRDEDACFIRGDDEANAITITLADCESPPEDLCRRVVARVSHDELQDLLERHDYESWQFVHGCVRLFLKEAIAEANLHRRPPPSHLNNTEASNGFNTKARETPWARSSTQSTTFNIDGCDND